MIAGIHGSYVEFVIFNGVTETYPEWFKKEIEESIYVDEHRFTLYVDKSERRPDYYEKTLVEDYSVFLRKPSGELHVTSYETFTELYKIFRWNAFTNSGVAVFMADMIEYVECKPGKLPAGYPEWFYEYFTEAVNFPQTEETVLFTDGKDISITEHYTFLRNKFGSIMGLPYSKFLLYYDPDPKLGGN